MDNTYTYYVPSRVPSDSQAGSKPKVRAARTGSNSRRNQAGKPFPRRLPLLLRRAWYSLNQTFRRHCTRLGITPDQFTVLRTLHESEPQGLNQRILAEQITSDPNTVAALLARMEQNGLIERRVDPQDRRAHCLWLKPAGRRVFAKAHVAAKRLQAHILEALPESRREVFLEELEMVANACQQALRVGRRSSIKRVRRDTPQRAM